MNSTRCIRSDGSCELQNINKLAKGKAVDGVTSQEIISQAEAEFEITRVSSAGYDSCWHCSYCTSVSADFFPVHADKSTLPPGQPLGSSENTTRFPIPSDVCMDQLSSASSYKKGEYNSSSHDLGESQLLLALHSDKKQSSTNPRGLPDPYFQSMCTEWLKRLYGLHQAPRACQDSNVKDILQSLTWNLSELHQHQEAAKTKLKDETDPPVNVTVVPIHDWVTFYLTASRPDIIFALVPFQTIKVNFHGSSKKQLLRLLLQQKPRLVSAGSTNFLLADYIHAAGVVYAVNTSFYAAQLVCAGSIMFLLAELFLLVVTCLCCLNLVSAVLSLILLVGWSLPLITTFLLVVSIPAGVSMYLLNE
ncbi:hypothetical protein Tco_1064454 [Tanacetum coccineum]